MRSLINTGLIWAIVLAATYVHAANTHSFALIGDSPYGVAPGQKYEPFDRLTADINDDSDIQWVLHAGDIKGGGTPCSDELFTDRLARFSHFKKPFILTLGDNEWTDCHRIAAGEYQPLERLSKLREVFFPKPGVSLGQKPMRLTSQAGTKQGSLPENVLWSKDSVIYAAIHMVGSANGLAPFQEGSAAIRSERDDLEVAARTRLGLDWLSKTFRLAGKSDAPGVFIMIHANPGLEIRGGNRFGFESFLEEFEAHVLKFGKPVILAHGDSHYFRIDKPQLDNEPFIPHFTRVETFGSSRVHWVKVHVDPKSPGVFRFEQKIVEGNP